MLADLSRPQARTLGVLLLFPFAFACQRGVQQHVAVRRESLASSLAAARESIALAKALDDLELAAT
jgi:hypothetical protein